MEHLIKTFDRNNDGKFQLSEMIQLLPVENNFMAQFTKSNIGEEDFDRIFQHYDQDNSGKVEGDEIGQSWIEYMHACMKGACMYLFSMHA